ARTVIRGLVSVAPKHSDVQKDVRPPIVGYDETISLGGIEPFDDAGYFDEVGGLPYAGQRIHRRIARRCAAELARTEAALRCPARHRTRLLGLKSVRPHNPGPHTSFFAVHRALTTAPSALIKISGDESRESFESKDNIPVCGA